MVRVPLPSSLTSTQSLFFFFFTEMISTRMAVGGFLTWRVNVGDHRADSLRSLAHSHTHPSLCTVCCLDGSLAESSFQCVVGRQIQWRGNKTKQKMHVYTHLPCNKLACHATHYDMLGMVMLETRRIFD